eukprot:3654760-Prymnesium_polylepis.1
MAAAATAAATVAAAVQAVSTASTTCDLGAGWKSWKTCSVACSMCPQMRASCARDAFALSVCAA